MGAALSRLQPLAGTEQHEERSLLASSLQGTCTACSLEGTQVCGVAWAVAWGPLGFMFSRRHLEIHNNF